MIEPERPAPRAPMRHRLRFAAPPASRLPLTRVGARGVLSSLSSMEAGASLRNSGEKVVHWNMGSKSRSATRMLWLDICQSNEFRGRWVALDNVRYDPSTAQPLEGDVVDADEDLADLCARMRASDRTACAILHCEDEAPSPPFSFRRATQRPRAAHH